MRVAVFGGGYAGLGVARHLEQSLPADVEIHLVDKSGIHVVRHLLHRAIRRPEVAQSLSIPLRELLGRTIVDQRRVTDLDVEAGHATMADGSELQFDLGAVCIGAEPAFYGIDGAEDHGAVLHRAGDAARIREGFMPVLDDGGRVVVGGGGLTGVQVAGELATLATEHDASEHVEITILEQADAVPPGLDERMQEAIDEALTSAGIDVRTGTTITSVDADRVGVAEGKHLAYDQFVWAGGIRGPTAVGAHRPRVPATLRLSERVFGAGDAVEVIDENGRSAPAMAHTAIRQAPVVAENIARLVEHRRSDASSFEPRLDRYRDDDLGWTVSIGADAVAAVGPSILTGPAAVGVKTVVGAGYLADIGAVSEAIEHVREAL
ncbi:NAD(P)/FAD-dependent oxidoreductase [Halorhabdus sp. CUG00001]|uniref:NAD(P)/FAD-dependent oxidoreductase n=1 Tax=Halorhabdus sp. CUG00001 TaxID=2600297 RepID=UPI00131EA21A|nr:FAD-dependent oxidoreductase [Halorhabdus sp. CUG00001]